MLDGYGMICEWSDVWIIFGVGVSSHEGWIGHHFLAGHAEFLDQSCGWVAMPVGLVELSIAHAVIVDVLVRSGLSSKDQTFELQRSKEDEDYIEKGETDSAKRKDVERVTFVAWEVEDENSIDQKGELKHFERMVGDTDISIEVEWRSLEKIDLINPIHDTKRYEGNQHAKWSFIAKEDGHKDLIDEVAVPLSNLKLRKLELFVQLALEGVDSVLVSEVSVSEPSLDFLEDPRWMDELVQNLYGRAVSDEAISVEVKISVRALKDVKEEESETWADDLSKDWLVHVCCRLVYLGFVPLAGHKNRYHLFEDSICKDDDNSSSKDEDLRRLSERNIQDGVRIVEHEIEAKQKHELKSNDQDDDEVRVYLYSLLFRVGKPKILPVDIVGIVCVGELQHAAVVGKRMRVSLVLI